MLPDVCVRLLCAQGPSLLLAELWGDSMKLESGKSNLEATRGPGSQDSVMSRDRQAPWVEFEHACACDHTAVTSDKASPSHPLTTSVRNFTRDSCCWTLLLL